MITYKTWEEYEYTCADWARNPDTSPIRHPLPRIIPEEILTQTSFLSALQAVHTINRFYAAHPYAYEWELELNRVGERILKYLMHRQSPPAFPTRHNLMCICAETFRKVINMDYKKNSLRNSEEFKMITTPQELQTAISQMKTLDAEYVEISKEPTSQMKALLEESMLSRIRQMQVDIHEYIKLSDRKAKYERGE